MSTNFATTAPFRDRFVWVARYTLGCLAVAVVAISLAEPAVHISSLHKQAPTRANTSIAGAGLLTASLIDSARKERPMQGFEPALWTVNSTPFPTGAYAGFVPMPAAASSLATR